MMIMIIIIIDLDETLKAAASMWNKRKKYIPSLLMGYNYYLKMILQKNDELIFCIDQQQRKKRDDF